jgi:hypothetical protein
VTCARDISVETARVAEARHASITRVVTPSSRDLPPGITRESWRTVLKEAADAWYTPCANVRLEVSAPVERWLTERDGANLFVFQGQQWCHNVQCGHMSTFPLRAMAMTTIYPEGARGVRVEEADVELNASSFEFTLGSASAGGAPPSAGPPTTAPKRKVALKNVLVHEMGHVLGLEDACHPAERPSGRPALFACSNSEQNSAMATGAPLDRPTSDDLGTLCRMYPRTAAAQQRLPAPGRGSTPGSCSAHAGHPGDVVALTAAAAVGYVARRRILRLLRRVETRKRSPTADERAHLRES